MANRTEYCALIGDYADRKCRWNKSTYVRRKFVLEQQDQPLYPTREEKFLWVNWRGQNPSSSDIRFAKPDEGGFQSYINLAWVKDGDVDLQPCEYFQENGDVDIHANSAMAWDDVEYIAGNCLLGTTWRFIDSRGDGVFTAEQIATGSGLTNAVNGEHNFSHNPTHAMRLATIEAQGSI